MEPLYLPPRIKLLTLGYAAPGAEGQLTSWMQAKHTLLIDIRMQPVSRWLPIWNRDALARQWGIRYLWKGNSLGNRNYKVEDRPKGILLVNPEQGIAEVIQLLKGGYRVILLCACKRAESCHRAHVADQLRGMLPMLAVEHYQSLVPVPTI